MRIRVGRRGGAAPIAPACSTAPTPAWPWPCCASSSSASGLRPHERVVVISTAHGLKFGDFKTAYHEGRLDGITSKHANRPVFAAELRHGHGCDQAHG